MSSRTLSLNRGSGRVGGGGRSYEENPGAAAMRREAATKPGPGPYVMSADTLEGDKVVNAKGEDLGKIESIMLDMPGGRIAYAVLSFGGFLGIGDKLFAIPWKALALDVDRKVFVLNIDKDRLMSAPGFDKNDWPVMANPEWAKELHDYYKSSPYWE